MSATNKVGTNSAETLTADANDIFLWGENGVDTVNGNALGNTIGGGNDNTADNLNGNGGDDTLLIQRGNDILRGDAGHDIALLADYKVVDTITMIGPVPVVTDRNGAVIEATFSSTQTVIVLGEGPTFSMRVGLRQIVDSSVGFSGFDGSNSKQDINLSTSLVDASRGIMTVLDVEEFQLSTIADVFYGNSASDTIKGRGGDDFLDGGAGADVLDGGTGNDTVSYQRSNVAVSIIMSTTLNSLGLQSFGHAEGDRLIDIENLIGSSFNDSLIADESANELHGQNGNDTLSGLDGDDKLFGGNGNDTLRGGDGFDELRGGSEDDSLSGGTAADVINGGTGNDTATYVGISGAIFATLVNTGGFQQRAIEHVGVDINSATATINGTASIDLLTDIENLIGTAFNDRISGNEEINILEGRNGNDEINGNGNNDVILGGAGLDLLRGDAGDDTLDGEADSDSLSGGIGNDLLRGGLGADFLNGGADNDTADYSEKTQTVIATLDGAFESTILVGVSLEDTLVNIENLLGGTVSDRLTGDGFANKLSGNGGADQLQGMAGLDTLDGGTGNDFAIYSDKSGVVSVQLDGANFAQVSLNGLLEDNIRNIENVQGGSGNDILFGDGLANQLLGEGGKDKISGGIGDDQLFGGDETDTITGDENNDTIHGDNGDDFLGGDAGDDHIFGDANNDQINGGLGLDELDGGTGVDTLSYVERTGRLRIELRNGADSTVTIDGAVEDTIRNFENAIGGSGGDFFQGNALANRFEGRDGDDFFLSDAGSPGDTYDGGFNTDTVSYFTSVTGVFADLLTGVGQRGEAQGDSYDGIENLFGSETQRDILIGNNVANRLVGLGGNDSIRGEGGNDILEGGAGADALNGGADQDTASYFGSLAGVNVNLLANTFSGGDAAGDTLFFIENLDGSGGNRDILIGNDLANIIRGFAGIDSIRGEGGNDTIEGGSGGDSLNGGAGLDTVSYETSVQGVRVDLRASLQDFGSGDSFNDTLFFFENIRGSNGRDDLIGSETINVIEGGAENDRIEGRGGSDRLSGGTGADEFKYAQAVWGADQILDFEDGVDSLLFDNTIADDITDFTITGNGTSSVLVRLNGIGGSNFTITGSSFITITNDDFVFGLP
jgi:Ca2+-binding RTX toxin-like protein